MLLDKERVIPGISLAGDNPFRYYKIHQNRREIPAFNQAMP